MADVDLAKLVAEQQGTLGEIARSLAAGDGAKVAAGATALVGALVTGHPEVALLAPFAERAYAKAFGSAADAMLRRELAALEDDEKRRAFVGQIGEAMEALLGQALVQLVRVDHRVKEEVLEALGGVRADLAAFREEFAASARKEGAPGGEAVRVTEQLVREGATGVRVRVGAAARSVFINRQVVSGRGSVGIDLT